jgi:hypothetical protein
MVVNSFVLTILCAFFLLFVGSGFEYRFPDLHKLPVRILTDPVPDQQHCSWGIIHLKFKQRNSKQRDFWTFFFICTQYCIHLPPLRFHWIAKKQ